MKKKVYIAGKVTELYPDIVSSKFQNAEIQVELLGFEAVNPVKVVDDFNCPWDLAMKKCIKALMDCDGAYFMPCCHLSPGALVELNLCQEIGMPIFFTYEDLAQWNN